MSLADDWAGPVIRLLLPGQSHRQYEGNNRGYSGHATRDRSSLWKESRRPTKTY